MRHLGVEVVEVVACVEFGIVHHIGGVEVGLAGHAVNPHDGGYHQQLGVCATGRDAEGGLFFHYRSLEVHFCRYQSYRGVAVQFLVVAVVLRDVEHRTQSAAEACREGAFIESYILHRIGVECREEATEVRDVVERHTVEQEKVLVGAATTHIHSAVAFATALYAWHQLQGLDNVGLAEHYRHRLDFLDRHLRGAHLRRACVADLLAHDGHLFEFERRHQFDAELAVAVKLDGEGLWLIAHELDLHLHGAFLQRERIVSIGVGHRAFATVCVYHRGADKCFATFGVGDGAAERVVLRQRHKGQKQK